IEEARESGRGGRGLAEGLEDAGPETARSRGEVAGDRIFGADAERYGEAVAARVDPDDVGPAACASPQWGQGQAVDEERRDRQAEDRRDEGAEMQSRAREGTAGRIHGQRTERPRWCQLHDSSSRMTSNGLAFRARLPLSMPPGVVSENVMRASAALTGAAAGTSNITVFAPLLKRGTNAVVVVPAGSVALPAVGGRG